MKNISLGNQLELLKLEYEYEKKEYERTTQMVGVGRKIRKGDCWFPVRVGRSYYNSLDRLVVEIGRSDNEDVDHNFEYGKTVCFFIEDGAGMLRYLPFRTTICYAEENRMVIHMPDESCLAQIKSAERLGVQLFFDETTYQLMFDALQRVMNAQDGRLAELKELFHGNRKLESPLHAMPIRMPWLNKRQEDAVNKVLVCKDVAIVHGPPGTGKTTTLVEAIGEVLRRETQVLVCAQSNTAVDWIAEQLSDRGVSVLRIGNPTRVTDKMLSFTYERRFEAHPDYPTLWTIRRTIRQLYSASKSKRSEAFHQKISRLRERADEIETRITHSLFDQSRVIACTLAGSANALLNGIRFHTLFIDEAAQALEAACWIAIQKADRVIFAGDHQQLPPTIKNPIAQSGGLSRTLMEHIAEYRPECVTLLTTQYRMNETLMRFSSDWFYEGKLEAAPSVKHRSLIDEFDHPLVWISSDLRADSDDASQEYGEETTGYNYGRVNKDEALMTLNALKEYIETVGMKRATEENIDFGIISPYRAQVQYLRKLFFSCKELKPLRRQVSINTVDSFQGQERDVIIISLVRANEGGNIGFLGDLRRMNVAMTRARAKLIIIGSASTLCKHKFYRELYKRCKHLDKKV